MKRCVLAWKSGVLVPFSDDAVAAADQQDCVHRRQCKREGRSPSGGAANVERWSRRRPMSTSLVGDECLWAAVFRLNGWLVCDGVFSPTRRKDARCVLPGGGFLRVFLHVVVCLGKHAGEFFVAFLRFGAQTSVAAGQEEESTLTSTQLRTVTRHGAPPTRALSVHLLQRSRSTRPVRFRNLSHGISVASHPLTQPVKETG